MKLKTRQALLILFVISCLSACNGIKYSSSSSESNEDSKNTTITDIDNSVNGSDASDNGNDIECDGNEFDVEDSGFLWKPVSEGDGNLVVLFPEDFRRPFLSVRVELAPEEEEEEEEVDTEAAPSTEAVAKEKLETESGTFDGYFEDGRQVWRFSKPGSAYTGKVIADDRSQECVWEIDGDPSERNE